MRYKGEIKVYLSEDKEKYSKVVFSFNFDPTKSQSAGVDDDVKKSMYSAMAAILNEIECGTEQK